jgi:hypothetical protein
MSPRFRSSRAALAALALLAPGALPAAAQVSIPSLGVPVSENFDTLASSGTSSTLPAGWAFAESGANANATYTAGTGSGTAGDTYSFGAASVAERAFGGLQSGALNPTIGAAFQNNTGGTITGLDVAYTGEQWRLGALARVDRLDFQYSLDATSLSTPTWTNVDALDFTAPVTGPATGALDGNAGANRTNLAGTIGSLSIAPGAVFWIRWTDFNASGADDGLSVDDFSLTANGTGGGVTLSVSDASVVEGDGGTLSATFTVSLSAPAPAGGVTFDVATSDGSTCPGCATTADNDYVARSLTGQVIPAGQQLYDFDVTVNGDVNVEPDETFSVDVANVAGTGVSVADGHAVGTIFNDDFVITPIHDIQGPGASSPIPGSVVTTRGVVTGVKSNGFFIQAPDAEADADPLTSEGIFVFTSSAPPPAAVVGNLVRVAGTVVEFIPSADPLQPPLTELGGSPTVALVSGGQPLPAPVVLTTTFPDPAGAHDQLERLEGMRVSVPSLTVSGPTLGSVNEPNATATSSGVFYGVVTGVARPFREAGVQLPDALPPGSPCCVPRFDTNPERIRVDSDGLTGGALVDVGTGAVVTGLVGPLDYTFRTYTVLPDPASPPGVSGGPTPTAATPPSGLEFTVASFNLERFFDDADDPSIGEPVLTASAYQNRLNKASRAIRNYLHFPDILGVAEVENLTTLQALAARINADAVADTQPDPQYVAHLFEGNDVGGIDVGFLVKTAPVSAGVPRVSVVEVVQEGEEVTWTDPADGVVKPLHDRPSLRLAAVVHHPNGQQYPVSGALQVIMNHLRSLNGVGDPRPDGATTTGERVRLKRKLQAEWLANFVQARQAGDPNERIVLVGDFNAFEVNDGFVDSMGTIRGVPSPDDQTVVPGDGADLVTPDFVFLFDAAPQRYSFIFDGNAQSLDHVLINQALATDASVVARAEHARIDADFPETARNDTTNAVRLSDHDPLLAYFAVSTFPVELQAFTLE